MRVRPQVGQAMMLTPVLRRPAAFRMSFAARTSRTGLAVSDTRIVSPMLEPRLLEKYGRPTPEALVESAFGHIALLEKYELNVLFSEHTYADAVKAKLNDFQDLTGIKVNLVQDGTSSLFARVKAEASNPQGDVIWGGVIDTYRANQDMLQPYTSSNVADLKDAAVDPNGYYTGFDMGPMVMIYNTDLISPEDAPTKWADLLDEKYKGQIATADPTASSSAFACIMSIILAYGTDNGEGYNFVEKLVENLDGKVIESSSGA